MLKCLTQYLSPGNFSISLAISKKMFYINCRAAKKCVLFCFANVIQLRTKFQNQKEALGNSSVKGIGVLGGAACGHSW